MKTKLRVQRPLHHGSLASRAPVVPLPRFAGAEGGGALALYIMGAMARRIRGMGQAM